MAYARVSTKGQAESVINSSPSKAIREYANSHGFFLMHAEGAKRRLLIFTDKAFYGNYKESRHGKIARLTE